MSALPARRVDCHAHVIDPERFPYSAGAGYRPRADEVGPREAHRKVLADHAITHALLVQPSCYGYDNSAMIDAIARAEGRMRGIAMVPQTIGDGDIATLALQGVVGVRLNLVGFDPDFAERLGSAAFLHRMRERGWWVQIYAKGNHWQRIAPIVLDSGVDIVIDHLGHPMVEETPTQPGFTAVLDLGRRGAARIKLSAPFRVSRQPDGYGDLAPFVDAIVEAFGIERCLWGSDWPFLNSAREILYTEQVAWLERVVPSAADRGRICWDNPAALFGFDVD